MPDAELLAHAAAGDLHKPEVLAAQARRMLKDARVRGAGGRVRRQLARLPPLRRAQHRRSRAVPSFNNDLREAMFEEPIRFMLDVFQQQSLGARFPLRQSHVRESGPGEALRHAGVEGGANDWVRVDDANQYGRGGLLPMAVFLTKNAPGLRTSPVKRGYWVVKRVLGEQIPPPPAVVPELPRDEAKLDLPLREMLAQHRADPSCAACHARFDSLGLVFEGYGPIGERRDKDLAGHPVDAHATFPGGSEGSRLRRPAQLHPRASPGRFRRQPLPQAAGLRPGPQPDALGRAD